MRDTWKSLLTFYLVPVAGIVILLSVLALAGCTANERARMFGGTLKVDLPCGQKLFDLTWKEMDFWYATRPMRAEEQPETYHFKETSSYGVVEGEVVITECR